MLALRAVAALALLAGCLQADSDGGGVGVNQPSCATCKRSSNAGGAAGGGSSSGSTGNAGSSASTGGGASSGGASTQATSGVNGGVTGGGSSGGSASDGGPVACPSILASAAPITCPSGSLEFSCQLVDYLQCTAVASSTVDALNPAGIPYTAASGLSAADGTVSLCVPQDSPFSLESTAAGYPTTYFPELQGVQPQELAQLGMLSSSSLTSISVVVPNGLDPGKGLVVINVNTSRSCDTMRSGWTVEMTIADGGSFPDGSYELAYLDSSGIPSTTLDATTGSGGAIFYNIDTSLTDFVDITYQNPDAGPTCQPQDSAYGFTGRVYVAGGALSGFPILLP